MLRHHPTKVCTIILRPGPRGPQVLAFHHPKAGDQIVKGTAEPAEPLATAAARELYEESGLRLTCPMRPLGLARIHRGTPADPPIWHPFAATLPGLPPRWQHYCTDDGGLTFRFFWHPVALPLTPAHSAFNDALRAARAALAGARPGAQRASLRLAAPR